MFETFEIKALNIDLKFKLKFRGYVIIIHNSKFYVGVCAYLADL